MAKSIDALSGSAQGAAISHTHIASSLWGCIWIQYSCHLRGSSQGWTCICIRGWRIMPRTNVHLIIEIWCQYYATIFGNLPPRGVHDGRHWILQYRCVSRFFRVCWAAFHMCAANAVLPWSSEQLVSWTVTSDRLHCSLYQSDSPVRYIQSNLHMCNTGGAFTVEFHQ